MNTMPTRRLRECVEEWPGCHTGGYDPRCCRFPKSCSATVYDEDQVKEKDLEPAPEPQAKSAEPQQVDTSTLLDLVSQYGEACMTMPFFRLSENAQTLLARIAALLPQQPVQARNGQGKTWWTHACGEVVPFWSAPNNDAHHCAPPCRTPGPWRPLLVGGDPAPEGTMPDAEWLRGELEACSTALRSSRDLMAQVMAELGVDRPEGVLIAIQKRAAAFKRVCDAADLRKEQRDKANADRDQMQQNAEAWKAQCDEARATLARYIDENGEPLPTDAELDSQIEDCKAQRDRMRVEVDRLLEINRSKQGRIAELQAEIERLKAPAPIFTNGKGEIHVTAVLDEQGSPRLAVQWPPGATELADPEYGALRSQIAHLEVELAAAQQVINVAEQPDPLVLSLPTVPKGTVAFVGTKSGRRYVNDPERGESWYIEAIAEPLRWDYPHELHDILFGEGSVRVEMAPPREPRTWPKLDGPPSDLKNVNGKHYRWKRYIGKGDWWYTDDNGDAPSGISLVEVQRLDGPLTEVFDDEPGGER